MPRLFWERQEQKLLPCDMIPLDLPMVTYLVHVAIQPSYHESDVDKLSGH